jgi:hypothetical protein
MDGRFQEPSLFASIVSVESSPKALLFWVLGEQTLMLYKMTEEELTAAIMKYLSVIFPHIDLSKQRPVAIHRYLIAEPSQ